MYCVLSNSKRTKRFARTTKGRIPLATLLSNLVKFVEGRCIGNPDFECHGANPPAEAQPNEITMIDDPHRWSVLETSLAGAVVTPQETDLSKHPHLARMSQIVVASPHDAFKTIVKHFRPPIDNSSLGTGIDPSALIDPSASVHPSAVIGSGSRIGPRTKVMPGVVIMAQCVIGSDCVLYPNVTLYEYTQIGDRVWIHASSVLGAHGFGYRQNAGRHLPTAQLGYVRVENDVEIGAAVTIDRGTYGATSIGEGTKIDNQVMIGHNCRIGRHNLLCSQVGIAGSCTTGDYVVLAGQVGLKDHVSLGDHTVVGAQAGVMEDCEGHQVYLGSPATPHREQMQIMAVQRRLPEMRREIRVFRRELDSLTQQFSENQVLFDRIKLSDLMKRVA
jgi:UDP-3-O-[3-hydroxymyristoyl] glucosamine N-acyltransferase